jgi:NADH-quinone oxidoreductase subunit L
VIQAIVFLPLLAALVAGLGQRAIGTTAAKLVTTGALFASCALSWPIFLSFVAGTGEAGVTPVLHWVSSGAPVQLGAARRHADRGDAGRHYDRFGARPPL